MVKFQTFISNQLCEGIKNLTGRTAAVPGEVRLGTPLLLRPRWKYIYHPREGEGKKVRGWDTACFNSGHFQGRKGPKKAKFSLIVNTYMYIKN